MTLYLLVFLIHCSRNRRLPHQGHSVIVKFSKFGKSNTVASRSFLLRRLAMRRTVTSGISTCGSSANLRAEATGFEMIKDFLIRLFDALGEWQDRSAARRRLASLDSRMLSDIGIDRATADAESAKLFWQC
jgi:uncharacterized protein YjiS (DUF1127 family)